MGPARDPRKRDRPWVHPDRPYEEALVTARDEGLGPDQHSAPADRRTAGPGRRRGLPGVRGVLVRHRPDSVRGRRRELRLGMADQPRVGLLAPEITSRTTQRDIRRRNHSPRTFEFRKVGAAVATPT